MNNLPTSHDLSSYSSSPEEGAKALGLETGLIAPSMLADFIAIDLNHPVLRGWSVDDLLDILFFRASSEVIKQVWVAGKEVC